MKNVAQIASRFTRTIEFYVRDVDKKKKKILILKENRRKEPKKSFLFKIQLMFQKIKKIVMLRIV